MKFIKPLLTACAVVALAGSASAVPTLTISDGATTATVFGVGGIAVYSNPAFDGLWSVVITTAETKPALGSATAPVMDLNVQATSLGGGTANPLTVTFSDDFFGPVNGTLQAQLSGHTVSGGTSGTVNYNTFYSTANTIPATTPLTASGTLVGPTYASVQTGSINAGSFSLSQVVKISQSPAASYSLDASLSGVPDGGTTVMLLGAAVSGLAFLRRKSA